MTARCAFDRAWCGPCSEYVDDEGDRCEEHRGKVCASCGAAASRECDKTMGPFVCGAPLCSDCEHTVSSNGCNSGGELPEGVKGHCRKGAQVFKVWYEDDVNKHNDNVLFQQRLARSRLKVMDLAETILAEVRVDGEGSSQMSALKYAREILTLLTDTCSLKKELDEARAWSEALVEEKKRIILNYEESFRDMEQRAMRAEAEAERLRGFAESCRDQADVLGAGWSLIESARKVLGEEK